MDLEQFQDFTARRSCRIVKNNAFGVCQGYPFAVSLHKGMQNGSFLSVCCYYTSPFGPGQDCFVAFVLFCWRAQFFLDKPLAKRI